MKKNETPLDQIKELYMDYEKEIADLASRITLLENKLNDEHQLRLGLEEKVKAQNNKIDKGEFESITATTIKIKPDDVQDPGIFMYSDDEKLLFETKINDKGYAETNFHSHKNEGGIEIGLCEHGAGRIDLKNTNGNSMVYLGSQNVEDDHSGRMSICDYSNNNRIYMTTCNPLISESNVKNVIEIVEFEDDSNKLKKMARIGTHRTEEGDFDDSFITLKSGKSLWGKSSTEKF